MCQRHFKLYSFMSGFTDCDADCVSSSGRLPVIQLMNQTVSFGRIKPD